MEPRSLEADTAVREVGPGRYVGAIHPDWWGGAGPHGGFVAALLMRALQAAVGDPARAARSLSIHFVARPEDGPLTVETTIEREGRSLTSMSARLVQAGEDGSERLVALALAAFSLPREAPALEEAPAPPQAPPPQQVPEVPWLGPPMPRMFAQSEIRSLSGPPFAAAPEARSEAWMRLRVPTTLDAPAVAFLLDALWPAVYSRLDRPAGAPTVDITMHFRRSLPLPGSTPGAWALGRFTTRLLAEGFFEEDGELWSEHGLLLAQSRQLALLRPPGSPRAA